MTTKLECCTKEPASHPLRSRLIWDLALGLGAAAYLALVLFDDLESPLLSIVLIGLVVHALVHPHSGAR